MSFLQRQFFNVILIRRIILIFRFGHIHRHRPHSCPCRQQQRYVIRKQMSKILVKIICLDDKCNVENLGSSMTVLGRSSICLGCVVLQHFVNETNIAKYSVLPCRYSVANFMILLSLWHISIFSCTGSKVLVTT